MGHTNIVYFDLETQKTANDVGGWERKDQMLMSVGVTFSTARGGYRVYPEHRAEELIEELSKADLVVGFNVKNFDYGVLARYAVWNLEDSVPTLDLMTDLESKLGRRPKLEDVAQASLGVGKIAEGLDAIRWWREGRYREVAEYCCFDVKVTKLVHEFGRAHGHVLCRDRFGQVRQLDVAW